MSVTGDSKKFSEAVRDAAHLRDINNTLVQAYVEVKNFAATLPGKPTIDALYGRIGKLHQDPASLFSQIHPERIHASVLEALQRMKHKGLTAAEVKASLTPEMVLNAYCDLAGEAPHMMGMKTIKAGVDAALENAALEKKGSSWFSKLHVSELSREQKIYGGLNALVAVMSGLSAISSFSHSVERNPETGERHIHPSAVGIGMVMALLSAGSVYASATILRGHSASI